MKGRHCRSRGVPTSKAAEVVRQRRARGRLDAHPPGHGGGRTPSGTGLHPVRGTAGVRHPRRTKATRSGRYARTLGGISLLILGASCGRTPTTASRPNVLLVTFDTMRADFLGCYGSTVTKTPTLDDLASRAVVFERAFATAPFTPPSLWSVLHAEQVRGHTYQTRIQDHYGKRGSIAGRFREAGYLTVGVMANSNANAANGFADGFDEYLDTWSELSFNNETTLARVLSLRPRFAGARRRSRPFFLFVHFFDPHGPWGDAPAPFRIYPPEDGPFARVVDDEHVFDRASDFQIARVDEAVRTYSGERDISELKRSGRYGKLIVPMYRSEITWSDDVLRRLLHDFRGEGLLDNTVVAVSSDHGTSFGEHYQTVGYVFPLFNEALRVPLLIAGPQVRPGRVTQAVSLLDLGPTLLDLAGIAREHAEGVSFRGFIDGDGQDRPVYAEATAMPPDLEYLIFRDERSRFSPGVENRHAALVFGQYKMIHMPARRGKKFELFDLLADPLEKTDLFRPDDPAHRNLALQLLERRRTGGTAGIEEFDPATEERLRALGYVR